MRHGSLSSEAGPGPDESAHWANDHTGPPARHPSQALKPLHAQSSEGLGPYLHFRELGVSRLALDKEGGQWLGRVTVAVRVLCRWYKHQACCFWSVPRAAMTPVMVAWADVVCWRPAPACLQWVLGRCPVISVFQGCYQHVLPGHGEDPPAGRDSETPAFRCPAVMLPRLVLCSWT